MSADLKSLLAELYRLTNPFLLVDERELFRIREQVRKAIDGEQYKPNLELFTDAKFVEVKERFFPEKKGKGAL